jgi:D-alanyl-D-alanine dipeptidase
MLAYQSHPPKGFVDLRKAVTGLLFDIRYHTAQNFTDGPLPGYGSPGAWMLKRPAQQVQCAQDRAAKLGLALLIYDAYRPRRATLAMAAWAKRTKQMHLFRQGYIAHRSGHNHGHTIDLTLVNAKTAQLLDMGTPFDTFSPDSHTLNARGQALKNRLLLRRIMQACGFRPYYKEWWHFSYPMKHTRPRDVPYACFEIPEGQWKPPKSWHLSGFRSPQSWQPKPCK